jgi:uncharacterized protein involved in outer membrane biogenesis
VFAGDWSASFAPGARPRLTANLYSEHVRVVDTGLIASEEEERPEAPPLFAEGRTLPFASLRDLDARLDFRIDRLTSGTEIEVRDLHVDIRLERGELTIRDFSASYETGRVIGGLRIDARESPASLALFLDASEIDLQRLADLIPGNQGAAGSASVWLNLRSSGGSPLRLRENLSGEVSWILEDGTLTSRYAQMFVVNLARVVFPTLPMLSTTESQPVECFRADLTLESGVATLRSLILQGPSETVTGSGRIDLAEGRYDLTMLPTTSRPGLLSVAAEVRVTGPLDAPRFKPVKRTIATSAARGLVSNALRPASALFRAFRGGSGAIEDDPCDAPLVRDPESRRPTWLQPPTG